MKGKGGYQGRRDYGVRQYVVSCSDFNEDWAETTDQSLDEGYADISDPALDGGYTEAHDQFGYGQQ